MSTVIRTSEVRSPILAHPSYADFAAAYSARCLSERDFVPAGKRVDERGLRRELHVWEGEADLAYVVTYDQFGRKVCVNQTTLADERAHIWADVQSAHVYNPRNKV